MRRSRAVVWGAALALGWMAAGCAEPELRCRRATEEAADRWRTYLEEVAQRGQPTRLDAARRVLEAFEVSASRGWSMARAYPDEPDPRLRTLHAASRGAFLACRGTDG